MKRVGTFSVLAAALAAFLLSGLATAGEDTEETPYTLATLTENIGELNKKEVVLSGTIVGVCKSGCKMWIAEGEYKKGDAFALVRAKDDAFKFDKNATGKKVVLHGYAVAKYLDYCAESGEEQEGAMEKCEAPVKHAKDDSKPKADAKRKVEDVTFFATEVEYL
jgi:hypothetical protein